MIVVDQKSKDKCHSKDKIIIIILNLIIEEWKFKKFNNENNNEKWEANRCTKVNTHNETHASFKIVKTNIIVKDKISLTWH